MTDIGPSPRILIVRLSAIGDVVQTMPIACAIREHFPGAFLAWAVQRQGAELLAGHEALDEVIALPRGWLKSPATIWQLRRRLRAMHFDIAVEAQGLTKAAVVAWLSGAPRRIGVGGLWGRELSPWLNTETVDTGDLHAVDRNMGLLRSLGIESPAVRFQIPEHRPDALAAERIIREAGVDKGFAIINAGAGWPSKQWPVDRFAAVARYLGERRRLPTMVLGGSPPERRMAEQITSGSGGQSQLLPPVTLRQLAALARRARLFVSCDTGPLHLAAAVGTPCVSLHGPFPARRHAPYGPQHVALQKMHLDGTTRQRRHASPKYMEAISVETVCEACDKILRRRDHEAA